MSYQVFVYMHVRNLYDVTSFVRKISVYMYVGCRGRLHELVLIVRMIFKHYRKGCTVCVFNSFPRTGKLENTYVSESIAEIFNVLSVRFLT